MPEASLNAAFYICEVPTFELREGLFHVVYSTGQCRFEFVFPPLVYFQAVRVANQIAGEYEDGTRDTVVPLRVVKTDELVENGH